MRKPIVLLVGMLFTMFLFTACAEQEVMAPDNSNMATPTVGVTEAVKPTLSPTPTNVPSSTLGIDVFQSETGVIDDSMLDEDACLFEYELKADGTIRITGIKDRALSTVCIPETIEEQIVTEIGAESFVECKNLIDIEIPLSVTTIGEEAFRGCSILQTVELPYAISSIGENAFAECAIDSFVVSQGTYPEFWAARNDYPISYSFYSLETDISMNMNEISVGGERYSAVYGETGALIWKYVDATFDRAAYYQVAFISKDDLPGMQLIDSKKGLYRTSWVNWQGIEQGTCNFVSVGDDVFEKEKIYPTYVAKEGIYFNGKNGAVFSEYTMNISKQLGDKRYKFERMQRLNSFSDGYALMCLFYEMSSDTERKYCWVDTSGNILCYVDFEDTLVGPYNDDYYSRIYHDEEYYEISYPGPYSDGVFYCDNKFLDLDLDVLIDLSGNDYKILSYEHYTPKFIDGVCRLIVYKNSKFWMFDIDKSGNTISEPEEIDILWLSY